MAVVLVMGSVYVIAQSKKSNDSNKEQFLNGVDYLAQREPELALPVIKSAYFSWRATFNNCDEFVSGGYLLFYPFADEKIFYDSVFNKILDAAITYEQPILKEYPEQMAQILFY